MHIIKIEVNTIAIPQQIKILAIPKLSAINPVMNNPMIEGNKLTLSKRENTRPKYALSLIHI